jgi:glycosyltransferase involved in cell wall biosynthesis
MKKICHIITQLELGGAQINTLKTLKHFSDRGDDLILITNQAGILNGKANKLLNVKKYFIKPLVREINPLKDIRALKMLTSILKKERPDIVHTHSSKAGILGRKAAKKAKIGCIIHTVHGYGFNYFKNKLIRGFAIFTERNAARITDKLIFVSRDDMKIAKELKLGRNEKYLLIRSGVDFNLFQDIGHRKSTVRKNLNLPLNRKIIINVAPFKKQKNIPLFLDIIKELRKDFEDILGIVIGDGNLRSKYETYIKSNHLVENILLLGFKENPRDFVYASDIFLSTSLWEGLPRSVLESLLLGIPVIAPNIGGINEVVIDGKNGFLYDNKENALKKIEILIKDEKYRQKLSKNAKKSISSEFSLETMLNNLENLYDNC